MPTGRIRVYSPAGLHHLASGQRFWSPGDYEFQCDDRSRGWLLGMAARGVLEVLPDPGPTVLVPEAQGEPEKAEPVQVIRPHRITVREKVDLLRARLARDGRVSFRGVVEECRTRMEVIVSFMAVLELIKSRVLDAVQDGAFADIVLVPSGEDALDVDDTSEFDDQA